MFHAKWLLMAAILGIGLFCSNGKAYSYAYDPWTTMTGEGIVAINPFLYVPSFNPLSAGGDLVAAYGFTPNIDLFVDAAGFGLAPSPAYNYSWAMLRYDLGANNILALQAGYSSSAGAGLISPQYHFFYENDVLAFEANLFASFLTSDFSVPNIGAFLAPVYKVKKDFFYVYFEVDPLYTVGGSFSLNLVPGIWINMGGAGQISLGITIANVTGEVTPGIAAWYWITFDTKKK